MSQSNGGSAQPSNKADKQREAAMLCSGLNGDSAFTPV
jgi:hypothetical protein